MAVDDEFGYHELLHTAHIMTCMWSDHIVDHGLLETNETLRIEAERILGDIHKFYQSVCMESDKKFEEE